MKKNLTEILFLLDKSSSMQIMGDEPIAGYNDFIDSQRDPSLGEAKVTLVLFGSTIDKVYDRIDIKNIKPITKKDYDAYGMTALRDAIGQTFQELGETFNKMDEADRPSKVIVCILSDGEDTSSRYYSTSTIKSIIETQTKDYSWEISFIGTTAEAISAANSYAINNNYQVTNDSFGVRDGYMNFMDSTLRCRSSN